MSNEQLLEKYEKVVMELEKGESLRRAAKLGECSLGTAQRVQKFCPLPKKIRNETCLKTKKPDRNPA